MNAPAVIFPCEGDIWQLLTGRVVSIRRITCEVTDHGMGPTECIVRYMDELGALANGEFYLTAAYVARGRRVGHD